LQIFRFLLSASIAVASTFVVSASGAFAQATPSAAASLNPGATPAPAKPVPVTSPEATPAPSATPYKLITFTGSSVDTGITTVFGSDKARFINGGPSRVFDAGNGPFADYNSSRVIAPANDFNSVPTLQNAILNVNFNGPFIGGRVEYGFGSDFDPLASNGQSRSGNGPIQAYVSAAKGPLTLLVGKYSTLAGSELLESAVDTNYSRSYTFFNAVPGTHTGARLTYAFSPKFSVIIGANNGWDDWKFTGKKKTLEGGLAIAPSPGYALTLQTYNGEDFYAFGNPAALSNRMLYDGVLTIHATSALTLIGVYDNATQLTDRSGAKLASGAPAFPTVHWNALVGYATYQFSPLYALSLRKETFHDIDGFRSGIVQRYQSSTATLAYTPNSNYIFRAEYRLDGSDGNNFTFRNDLNGIGRAHQPSLALEAIVKFP